MQKKYLIFHVCVKTKLHIWDADHTDATKVSFSDLCLSYTKELELFSQKCQPIFDKIALHGCEKPVEEGTKRIIH